MEGFAKATEECPTENELREYHSGKSGRKKAQMKNHVSGCPRCKGFIKQWSQPKHVPTPSLRTHEKREAHIREAQARERKKSSLHVVPGGFMKDGVLVQY